MHDGVISAHSMASEHDLATSVSITVSSRDNEEIHPNIISDASSLDSISKWKTIMWGQAIAFCLASCSISSAALQNIDGMRNMPLFQLSSVYLSLTIHLIFLGRHEQKDIENQNNLWAQSCSSVGKDETVSERTALIKLKQATTKTTKQEETAYIHFCAPTKFWCLREMQLHSPWYFYAILAFLDVQANFFVVLSFRYTAVVNSTILTSLSILSVIITSKIILKRIFNGRHFAGALSCILGASCIMALDIYYSKVSAQVPLSDSLSLTDALERSGAAANANTHVQSSTRLLGDVFAIVAALLFGLNDTLTEYSVHNSTPNEYLGMLGFFGFIFSFCESLIFEYDEVIQFLGAITIGKDNDGDGIDMASIYPIWVGYIVTFYLFYVSASHFLIDAYATMMSLSLQTANVWTCLYSIFVQKMTISPLFFSSLCLILFGVWLYESGSPSPVVK
jgi:drug/metabolite transporter (DMT)-like permease